MTEQDKPAVDFSFDNWERETEVKPFAIVIGGKRYESVDPLDLDYREFQKLMDAEDVDGQFKMMFPKDHEKILATKVIKAGALQEFTQKVVRHYGLDPTAA